MERKQFTFYRSYLDAIIRLPKKEQGAILLAICQYALNESEPTGLSPIAETVFTLVRPTLDAGRRKANAGEAGGKSEAKQKQTASKTEAKAKQTPMEKEGEIEKEVEIEVEIEKENECYIPPKSPKGEWEWYTQDTELLSALRGFEAMRNKIKAPMTPRARKLLAGELDKLAGDIRGKIAILDQSIVNNWKSVYAIKGKTEEPRRYREL